MTKSFFQKITIGLLALGAASFASCTKNMPATSPAPVVAGVSEQLAANRKELLRQVAYTLAFNLPENKEAPIPATETITFTLLDNRNPLQLDFKEKTDHLQQVVVNNKEVAIVHQQEHLIIPAEYLKKGTNQVAIRFVAGDLSLNRSDGYLYTLLVPDRARTVFPCFDQPNLKATFTLSLTLPRDWRALANGPLQDSVVQAQTKTYHFAPSDTISTYLFAFAAGKFDEISRAENGRALHFYHRETDSTKIAQSITPIFRIHQDALAFMRDYTGIPYPFKKFDFVAIPDFQYGGMEHVGAIQYRASSLFLDEGATQDQKIARSNLISHETAHMWFGDLVTMQWFNDVWTKEVFANFMADKITQVSLADANYDLKFLVDHFPAAYAVDRTAGANPIRQPLDNLQDAGSMYGNIIYHKAPVMMRQLERLMGEEAFRKGLQQYLKTYAYGNATWPDLIGILDANTPADLQAWNQVWVNEPGRPVFDFKLALKEGKIADLSVSQQSEDGSDRLWPQFFEVTLVYPDHTQELTVNMDQQTVRLPEATGAPTPQFILFNSSGQGYGVFPVDAQLTSGLYTMNDPVARASAYITLYENMLNGRYITPAKLLQLYRGGLGNETEELNLKLLTGQLSDIYWKLLLPAQRQQLAAGLEQELWNALQHNTSANAKKLLFKTYQSIALTPQARQRLYQIWQKQEPPAGVKLAEDDYTSLALALAVREYAGSDTILATQLARIKNPDRKKRLEFMLPALSADVQVRDAFFASLLDARNREKESWVLGALAYLHHPLRTGRSEKYLRQSLDVLEEIQLTGDIFFPYGWLQATFGAYQSPAAAQVVHTFLQEHPGYNPKLKAKILQAADDLFRAEKLVNAREPQLY